MKKTLLGISVASFIVVVAAACGGGNTNENTNTTPPPAQDASAATTASATPAQDAGPAKPTVDAQREPFVQACMRKMPAQAYCSCMFDQYKDVFKDTDLTAKPSDAQMATLKQKTITNCVPKLTEADVKTAFASECVSDNPKKQAWCDCWWTTYRSKLEVADFVSDMQGQKFVDAKKAVVTQCKGKLPEDILKSEFATTCNKGAADHVKACDCMWKKLRAKGSVEELAVGLTDISKAGLETCKTQ